MSASAAGWTLGCLAWLWNGIQGTAMGHTPALPMRGHGQLVTHLTALGFWAPGVPQNHHGQPRASSSTAMCWSRQGRGRGGQSQHCVCATAWRSPGQSIVVAPCSHQHGDVEGPPNHPKKGKKGLPLFFVPTTTCSPTGETGGAELLPGAKRPRICCFTGAAKPPQG